MITNRKTFFIGIFIFLMHIDFLGFTSFWETSFTVISALAIIILSVKITIPKRSTIKKIRKKEKTTDVFTENSPMPKMEDIIINRPVNNSEENKTE